MHYIMTFSNCDKFSLIQSIEIWTRSWNFQFRTWTDNLFQLMDNKLFSGITYHGQICDVPFFWCLDKYLIKEYHIHITNMAQAECINKD